MVCCTHLRVMAYAYSSVREIRVASCPAGYVGGGAGVGGGVGAREPRPPASGRSDEDPVAGAATWRDRASVPCRDIVRRLGASGPRHSSSAVLLYHHLSVLPTNAARLGHNCYAAAERRRGRTGLRRMPRQRLGRS